MGIERETNTRDNIGNKSVGGDRWQGYAPKDLAEDFGNSITGNKQNIFNALSEIQRFYVIEERSDELPREYFTIEQILNYLKIGFKNGLYESLIFVTLVPILQIIYPSFKNYFFNDEITNFEKWVFIILSYTPMILSTLFMIYISKYYKGALTRRAIFSLMNGRSFAFVLKGIIFYYLMQFFVNYSLSHPLFVYGLADWTAWIINFFSSMNIFTQALYEFYYIYVIPALKKASLTIFWTMMGFALMPYLTIFYKGYRRRVKKQKIKEEFENY